jgi:hypothetical protein
MCRTIDNDNIEVIPFVIEFALLFADLVIYAYGAKSFKTKTRTEAKAFDLTFKYVDDVL